MRTHDLVRILGTYRPTDALKGVMEAVGDPYLGRLGVLHVRARAESGIVYEVPAHTLNVVQTAEARVMAALLRETRP